MRAWPDSSPYVRREWINGVATIKAKSSLLAPHHAAIADTLARESRTLLRVKEENLNRVPVANEDTAVAEVEDSGSDTSLGTIDLEEVEESGSGGNDATMATAVAAKEEVDEETKISKPNLEEKYQILRTKLVELFEKRNKAGKCKYNSEEESN